MFFAKWMQLKQNSDVRLTDGFRWKLILSYTIKFSGGINFGLSAKVNLYFDEVEIQFSGCSQEQINIPNKAIMQIILKDDQTIISRKNESPSLLRYDTDCIENYASTYSCFVACVFVATVTFVQSCCLATIGDGLRCHDIHAEFHKEWFRHSKTGMGWGDLINLLLRFK